MEADPDVISTRGSSGFLVHEKMAAPPLIILLEEA